LSALLVPFIVAAKAIPLDSTSAAATIIADKEIALFRMNPHEVA